MKSDPTYALVHGDGPPGWTLAGPAAAQEEAELRVPEFCGYSGVSGEVEELANQFYFKANTEKLKQTPLSMSWCVGPCLATLFRLACFSFLVHPGMLALAFLTAHCQQGIMAYSYFSWCPFILWVCLLSFFEWRCLRYATVPYLQHVGSWQFGGRKVTFTTWCLFNMGISFISQLSIATPSLFTGTVLARHFRNICQAEQAQDIWFRALRQSSIFRHIAKILSFPVIVGLAWTIQFLPVAFTLWKTWPWPGQWKVGGVNMQKTGKNDETYKQDLELECIEYIPAARKTACKFGARCNRPNCRFAHPGREAEESGMSVIGKSRPEGTRYFYYALSQDFLLIGSAFSILGEGLFMYTIQTLGYEHAESSALFQLKDIESDADDRTFAHVLGDAKKTLQHVHSIQTRLKIRILVNGILASGVQLQIQITMYAISSLLAPTATLRVQEVISIASAIYSATDVAGMFFQARRLHLGNNSIPNRIVTKLTTKLEDSFTRTNSNDSVRHSQDAEEVETMRKALRWDAIQIGILAGIFFGLFVWSLLKLVMIHVCEDHLWNVMSAVTHLSLPAGCVNEPKY